MADHNDYYDKEGRLIDPDWGEVTGNILSLDEYYAWNDIFWSQWWVEFEALMLEE